MPSDMGPLRRAVENWWSDWNPARRFGEYVSDRMLKLGKAMLKIEHDLFARLVQNPKLRKLLTDNFTEPPTEGYEVAGLLYLAGALVTAVVGITNYAVPITRTQRRAGNVTDPNEKIDIGRVILLYLRRQINEKEFSDRCYEYGYNDQERALLIRAVMNRLDPMMCVMRHWRGLDGLEQYMTNMEAIGYEREEAQKYLETLAVIPGVQDLIAMQVREAWNDTVAARFEYDAGDYSDAQSWAEKQGLDPDWVKRYWRAHWQLPSVQMGVEMVHRLRPGTTDVPFTREDLELLMQANDIPQFFRERILRISAALLTRVDIRRLYQAGLISGDRLVGAYLDLGYSDEDAKALAAFAMAGASEAEKDLTLSQLTGAYVDGIIGGDEYRDNLVKMGYDQNEADILKARADLDIATAELNSVKTYIQQRYQRGMISEQAARDELSRYGLRQEKVDGLVLSWTRSKKLAAVLPSQAKAESWYLNDITTKDVYAEYLKAHGYAEKEVQYYLADADRKREATELIIGEE